MRAIALALAFLAAPAFGQTDAQLQYACRDFVKQSLHDPRDADLEWTTGTISKRKDGLFVVRFRGRAKNAYGALRLSIFECVIRYSHPDNFYATSIRVLE